MSTHKMHFPELPHYLTVKRIIERDEYAREGGTVRVVVESTIHVQREIEMPTSFSLGFVQTYPNRFRNDVLCFVTKTYGLKPEPLRYS